MKIAVQTLTVQAGAYSASIDPPDLTLDVPGGVTLTGGSANGALCADRRRQCLHHDQRDRLSREAPAAGATQVSRRCRALRTITVASDDRHGAGHGGPSAGAWMSAAGPLNVTAVSCNGCTVLRDRPVLSSATQAGLFGNPVSLTLFGSGVLQVPSSVIVGVQTAQTGGEGDAVLSKEEEEEKKKEQSADEARAKEEHKHEKPRQVCM